MQTGERIVKEKVLAEFSAVIKQIIEGKMRIIEYKEEETGQAIDLQLLGYTCKLYLFICTYHGYNHRFRFFF